MNTKPASPRSAEDEKRVRETAEEEPGTNAVEHEPDPKAAPIPDGEHKFVPRSPYTTGND